MKIAIAICVGINAAVWLLVWVMNHQLPS